MEKLEIPVLKALYYQIDSRKFRIVKSEFIRAWKAMKLRTTGVFPKTRDRIHDVLNGYEHTPEEYEFLNLYIPIYWRTCFGESEFESQLSTIRAGMTETPYEATKRRNQERMQEIEDFRNRSENQLVEYRTLKPIK